MTYSILWKTAWSFLKRLKMELLYDPAVPLLEISPKNLKTPIRRIYAPLCSQ